MKRRFRAKPGGCEPEVTDEGGKVLSTYSMPSTVLPHVLEPVNPVPPQTYGAQGSVGGVLLFPEQPTGSPIL